MKKLCLLIMFLACVSFAPAQYINWVVGGAGTGADKASTNAGFYDADIIEWSEMQGTNGASMGSDAVATSTNNGSGNVRLQASGDQFDLALVGMGMVGDFAQDESADGYHLVTAVDTGNNTIDIDIAFGGDGENCNVVIGGALANPGEVPDTDDFAAGYRLGDGDVHKIWIRAIADYTAEDEGQDTILYINQPGTATAPIVWESHFAEIENETGDFGIATFDGQNALANCIKTAVGGNVYHVFIGISCERATDDGANLNTIADDNVTFIRCQFVNNGVWGVQGDDGISAIFCDFDTNGGGGFDGDFRCILLNSVFRNNTGDGCFIGTIAIVGCLSHDNSDSQLRVSGTTLLYANTVDGSLVAGTEGIVQDSTGPGQWAAVNNIIIDCVLGIQDDSSIGLQAMLWNNLYSNNTTDTDTNITPVPADGDVLGNIVDPANVFSSGYILHPDNKGKGVDASFTQMYWDDFNGGAGDNPPNPLTGLSFMDMGSAQREEAGGGGGLGAFTSNKSGGKQ